MKRTLFVLPILALSAVPPAAAERLYVPVVGGASADRPLATSVWVASADAEPLRVTAELVDAAGAHPARTFAVTGGARQLDGLAAPGATGLIALEASPAAVSAWVDGAADGEPAEVPVIGSHDAYAAGAAPTLELAVGHETLRVGAANLGDAAATCHVELEGAATAPISFAVPPRSFAGVDAAADAGRAASSARVRCDQPFYPLAVTTGDDLQVAVAKASGANGACNRWLSLAPQPDGSYLAATAGTFHQATSKHPKGVLCIRAPRELRIARAVYEWDVVAGPWWPKRKDGIHNLGYFFGERYRSGVIGNVNTIGTRNQLKFMQNYGMTPGTNTNISAGYQIQKGARYHASYTFDAAQSVATLRFYRDGVEVKSLTEQTFAPDRTLLVQPYGEGRDNGLALVAEFGNYATRGMPEVPTIGWVYGNFRLRLYPR
jgi:hypothetical protein